MVQGIGVDIIKTSRMQAAIERKGLKFVERFCTAAEIKSVLKQNVIEEPLAEGSIDENDKEYLDSANWRVDSVAGLFASKEAFGKAMGTGISQGVNLREIEIVYDELGAPSYVLHGDTLAEFKARGYSEAKISISHDGGLAIAFCVIS